MRRLPRRLAAIALALAAILPPAALTTAAVTTVAIAGDVARAEPAGAGWYTWEAHPCRPDIWWLATEEGVWYYHLETGAGPFLVQNGAYLNAYASQGYQCGSLGAPTSGLVYLNNHELRQYFEGGYLVTWWY